MNASASPAAHAATAAPAAAPPPSLSTLAGQAGNVPLTRVSLAYIEPRFKLYLRFGEPVRTLRLDRWRRCAVFLPRAMFCRVRWEANDYGTIRWQLMVMQAATPLDDIPCRRDESGLSGWAGASGAGRASPRGSLWGNAA